MTFSSDELDAAATSGDFSLLPDGIPPPVKETPLIERYIRQAHDARDDFGWANTPEARTSATLAFFEAVLSALAELSRRTP